MVVKCLVCPNKYGPLSQISFHRFPMSAERCKQWAILCRRNDLLDMDPDICYRHYKLCSRHFDESQFVGTRLIPNAVPSKFEWNGYLNEQHEITDESINSEPVCSQVEVTEHCSPIDWSQIQSTSTPKSNSVARSLVGSYSSIASTASTTKNFDCAMSFLFFLHRNFKKSY